MTRAMLRVLVTSVAVCLLSSLSAFAQTTISFMASGDHVEQTMHQEVIAAFEESHPHINVDYLLFPGGSWAKVRAMFAGGTAPDVIRVNDDDVYPLAINGALTHLGPYIDRELDRSDYYPIEFTALDVDGEAYVINPAFGSNVYYYNTDLVKDAGVTLSDNWDSPHEWDEWVSNVHKLTKDVNGDGRTDQYGVGYDSSSWLTSFLYSNGADPLSGPDGINFTHPNIVEIFEEVTSLVHEHNVAPYVEEDPLLLFNNGLLAMEWVSMGNEGNFQPDLNWNISPAPKAKVKPLTTNFVRTFGIPTTSQHPDEAFELLKFMLSETAQRIYVKYNWGIPARRSVAEEVFAPGPNVEPENRHVFAQALDHDAPLPKDPLGAVWKKFATHELGDEALNGTTSVRDFLERIQLEVEREKARL